MRIKLSELKRMIKEEASKDIDKIIFDGTDDLVAQLKKRIMSNIRDGISLGDFDEEDLYGYADSMSSLDGLGIEQTAFIEVFEEMEL